MKCTRNLTPEEQQKILDDLRKAAAAGKPDGENTSSEEVPLYSSYDTHARENGSTEDSATGGATSDNTNRTGQGPTGTSSQSSDSTSNTTNDGSTQAPNADDVNEDVRNRTRREWGEGEPDRTSGTNEDTSRHSHRNRKASSRSREEARRQASRARGGPQENLEIPQLQPAPPPTIMQRARAHWDEWMGSGGWLDGKEVNQIYEGVRAADEYVGSVTDGFVNISERFDQGLRMMDGIMRSTSKVLNEAIKSDYGDSIPGHVYISMSEAMRGSTIALGDLDPATRQAISAMRGDLDQRTRGLIRQTDQHLDRLLKILENGIGTEDYLGRTQKIYKKLALMRDGMQSSLEASNNALRDQARYEQAQATGVDPETGKPVNDLNAFKKALSSNSTAFIHRAYQYNADPRYREEVKTNPQMQARARLFFAQLHLENAAIAGVNMTQQELDGLVNASILEVFTLMDKTSGTALHVTNADAALLSDVHAFRFMKQVPDPILELLGEIKDPMVNYAVTAQQRNLMSISLDYSNEMLKSGVKYGLMSTVPTSKLDTLVTDNGNSPALMLLSNLYVPKAMNEAIQEHFLVRTHDGIVRNMAAAASMLKIGKTVLSPGTAIRNWLSAVWMISVHGGWNMDSMEQAITVSRSILKGAEAEPYIQMLISQGVVGDGIAHQGLLKLSEDIGVFDRLSTQMFANLSDEFSVASVKGTDLNDPNKQVDNQKVKFKNFMNLAFRFYQGADDFPKVMIFEKYRATLAQAYETTIDDPRVIEEAAMRTKDTAFTYSKVPKVIKAARSIPILTPPFISFPAEVIRTSVNMARSIMKDLNSGNEVLEKNAWVRIASIMGTAVATEYAAGLIAQTVSNITSDDEELVKQMEGRFEKNENIIPLYRYEDGSYEVLNMSRYNPYSILRKVIAEIVNDDDEGMVWKVAHTTYELIEPFAQSDILTTSISQAMEKADVGGKGVDPWTSTEVFITEVMKTLPPTIVSQTIRVMDTYGGNSYDYGVGKRAVPRELSKLFGTSTQLMNPNKQLQFAAYDYSSTRNALQKNMRRVAKDLNTSKFTSDFLVKGQIERYEAANQKVWGTLVKKVNFMRQRGMSNAEISNLLKLRGSGKGAGGSLQADEMDRLLRNMPAPKMPYPEDAVRQVVNQVRINSGAEAARDVQLRLNEIRGTIGY